MQKRFNLKITALVMLILGLIAGIIIILMQLKEDQAYTTSQTVTKVAEKTYTRNISLNKAVPTVNLAPTLITTLTTPTPTDIIVALNRLTNTPMPTRQPTTTPTPTNTPTNTPTKTPTPTFRPTATPQPTVTIKASPTPTQIVLAQVTSTPLPTYRSYNSPSPTTITILPKAGYLHFTLLSLVIAGLVVIFSLVI